MVDVASYEHPSGIAVATASKSEAPAAHGKPSRIEIEEADNGGFVVMCLYDGGESTKKVFGSADELVSFIGETYGGGARAAQSEMPLGGGGLNMARPMAPTKAPAYDE